MNIRETKHTLHTKNKYKNVSSFLDTQEINSELKLGALFGNNNKLVQIVIDRYYNKKTLDAIGKKFNVTREYIRQCEDQAIKKLETYLGNQI